MEKVGQTVATSRIIQSDPSGPADRSVFEVRIRIPSPSHMTEDERFVDMEVDVWFHERPTTSQASAP